MENEEALQQYDKMVEIFGEHLPNPEQEPIRFQYYVKLYNYYFRDSDVSSASDGSGASD